MNNRTIRQELAKTKVSSKQAVNSEVKRLATMINQMKSILWDYIRISFPHIYDETYGKGVRKVEAAICMIDNEKQNKPGWGPTLASIFHGYKLYYRLDHIVHLESLREGFKYDLIEFKRILKTIKNYNDCHWTLDDVDGVMEELECEALIDRMTQRFNKMILELRWKMRNDVNDFLQEDNKAVKETYTTSDEDEIEFNIIGYKGQWSEGSAIAAAVKQKLFENSSIKLGTLAVAMESCMNQKIREAITRKIKDRLRHQEPMVELRAENTKLSVEVAKKEGEIARQCEVNKSLEKERDKINSLYGSRETLYASQEVKICELSAQNRLLKEQNQALQRGGAGVRKVYK